MSIVPPTLFSEGTDGTYSEARDSHRRGQSETDGRKHNPDPLKSSGKLVTVESKRDPTSLRPTGRPPVIESRRDSDHNPQHPDNRFGSPFTGGRENEGVLSTTHRRGRRTKSRTA